jgi:S1-C subfamily serine protease
MVVVCTPAGALQAVAASPGWQVGFPALGNGTASESAAVPLDSGTTLVVVVSNGANPNSPQGRLGGNPVPVKLIGHDPVSRLGFIRASGSPAAKPLPWAADAGKAVNAPLKVIEADRTTPCRAAGWIKQVGGKVLPFALLRINFTAAIPPPGTPLVDGTGRIVALVFQGSGSGSMGYAIPAEAVHRVEQDMMKHGKLIRAWSGIALRAESPSPQISRILPDSPAAAAGIQANDVLLSIGSRRITEYADAANAFFYLIPGQPVSIKLQRGGTPMEFSLTPIKPKS